MDEFSRYYVNGFGQMTIMIIPEGYEPAFFRVEGVDADTLEFILERIG
jgi:hypothetical protein